MWYLVRFFKAGNGMKINILSIIIDNSFLLKKAIMLVQIGVVMSLLNHYNIP
jgi:hypothetical protein